MRDGRIGEHSRQKTRRGYEEWKDWRTQGTKKQAEVGGLRMEGLENTEDKETSRG